MGALSTINVKDFRFWFTYGRKYKFMSSKFWKSNKWEVGIRTSGWKKFQKVVIGVGGDYSVHQCSLKTTKITSYLSDNLSTFPRLYDTSIFFKTLPV